MKYIPASSSPPQKRKRKALFILTWDNLQDRLPSEEKQAREENVQLVMICAGAEEEGTLPGVLVRV